MEEHKAIKVFVHQIGNVGKEEKQICIPRRRERRKKKSRSLMKENENQFFVSRSL